MPRGKKGKPHVGTLLLGRREARNIFVVARLVDDFADGQNENREVAGPHSRINGENHPGQRSDQRSQNDRA